ncbi:hypothetical protein HOD83_03760 [Candidatus Woesearchaeota archaeon]|nr:hypothetical protein [Candidatus Woesearchaeota archaeon]
MEQGFLDPLGLADMITVPPECRLVIARDEPESDKDILREAELDAHDIYISAEPKGEEQSVVTIKTNGPLQVNGHKKAPQLVDKNAISTICVSVGKNGEFRTIDKLVDAIERCNPNAEAFRERYDRWNGASHLLDYETR